MTEEKIHYDMIAVDALRELPLAERVQAVLKAFEGGDERDELLAWLHDDKAEKEA
jgi:hypothetical protein